MTLRSFAVASGAFSVLLALDQGEELAPLVVECPAEGPATLSEGEDAVQVDAARLAAPPLLLPEVRALPPFDVDALRAEVTAPLGGVEHLARAVRSLAELFGGRSVVTAAWETSDPDAPLHLSARVGEPMVLGLGDEQFEMGASWPGG